MTPRIKLDPRRIQVWQYVCEDGGTLERITSFDGVRWMSSLICRDGSSFETEDWKKSELASWLDFRGFTELTARSDA